MPFVRDLPLVATVSILVRWVLRHAPWACFCWIESTWLSFSATPVTFVFIT